MHCYNSLAQQPLANRKDILIVNWIRSHSTKTKIGHYSNKKMHHNNHDNQQQKRVPKVYPKNLRVELHETCIGETQQFWVVGLSVFVTHRIFTEYRWYSIQCARFKTKIIRVRSTHQHYVIWSPCIYIYFLLARLAVIRSLNVYLS